MSAPTTVHLFVPCLVRDVLPGIGRASLALLRHLGLSVTIPDGQTCCGQLLYKQGAGQDAALLAPVARRFLDLFAAAPAVVAPSASCVAMVRAYPGLFAPGTPDHARAVDLAGRVFELSDFLANVLGLADLGARFDGPVAFHASCQAEGLGITDAARRLLAGVRGLDAREPSRTACCGFGGGFSLAFPDISRAILEEKAADLAATGASLVTAVEPSCLTHMDGFFRGQGLPLRTAHLAEILAQGLGLGVFVDERAGNALSGAFSGGRP